MIFAVGKEVLTPHAGMEKTADIVVGGGDAHAVGFLQQDALHDDLLPGLLHDDGHVHVRNLAPAHQVVRSLLHIGDRRSAPRRAGSGQRSRLPDAGVVGAAVRRILEDAGNEEDDHGDAGGADDDAEQPLGEASVFLQEANHAMGNSLFCGPAPAACPRGNGRAERQMS